MGIGVDAAALLERLDAIGTPDFYDAHQRVERERYAYLTPPDLLGVLRRTWQDAASEGTHELLALLPQLTTFEERYGVDQNHWGAAVMLAWWFICDAMGDSRGETTLIEGDLTVKGTLVIEGDLHVRGALLPAEQSGEMGFNLIVLGDLIVEGSWRYDGDVVLVKGVTRVSGNMTEKSDWSLVAVNGGVEVEGWLSSRGELYVRGEVSAPLIELTYNHGHARFGSETRALLFCEFDHSGSWGASWPEAPLVVVSEMRFEDEQRERSELEQMEQLQELLDPAVFERVSDGMQWSDEEAIFLRDDDEVSIRELVQELVMDTILEGSSVDELFEQAQLTRFREA